MDSEKKKAGREGGRESDALWLLETIDAFFLVLLLLLLHLLLMVF